MEQDGFREELHALLRKHQLDLPPSLLDELSALKPSVQQDTSSLDDDVTVKCSSEGVGVDAEIVQPLKEKIKGKRLSPYNLLNPFMNDLPAGPFDPAYAAYGDTFYRPGKPQSNDSIEKRKGKGSCEFMRVNQIWSPQARTWVARTPSTLALGSEYANEEGMSFVAKHRMTDRNDKEGIYEFDIMSQSLLKILRVHIPHAEELYDIPPTIEGKELFLGYELLRKTEKEKMKILRRLQNGETMERKSIEKRLEGLDIPGLSEEVLGKDSDGLKELERLKKKDSIFAAEMEEWDELATDGALDKDKVQLQLYHLTTLLDFVHDEAYNATWKKLRALPQGQISFKLLWTLISSGKVGVALDPNFGNPMAFEIIQVKYRSLQNGTYFIIEGEYIEFTGREFCRIPYQTAIPEFKGLRDATTLPVMLLDDGMKKILQERGQKYVSYAGVHHLEYEGSISKIHPTNPGNRIKLRASGRVMVDVKSYRKMNPNFDRWLSLEHNNYVDQDLFDPYGQSVVKAGPRHQRMMRRQMVIRNGWANNGPTITDTAPKKRIKLPSDDELHLLPPSVFGFSLKYKEWGEMDIEGFKEVKWEEGAFDHLVLDDNYKHLIKSLITPAEATNRALRDVIQGKSGGVVILLEGSPGTGKTLTCEACSELLHRPLYCVGSGDLGWDSGSCENALRNIFDVAKDWDAIVLLDEADVFLERRSRHNVTRNGLVSTFLRMIEYQDGIMFMTTNRISSLDPAFFSRFSVALRYPNLGFSERLSIWTKFISLISPSPTFESNVLAKFAKHDLNGRLIKRCLQTAQALSNSRSEPLTEKVVLEVIGIIEKFQSDVKSKGINPDDPEWDPEEGIKHRLPDAIPPIGLYH